MSLAALPGTGGVERVGDRVASGDTYPPDVLALWAERAAARVDATCDVRFLTSAVLIAAKAADLAGEAGDLAQIDRRRDETERAATRLVGCAPVASFGWLSLFWVRLTGQGYDSGLAPLLRRSYETGVREGWVQVRRSALAMRLFPALPPDLQDRAAAEFVDLVRIGELDLAAGILARADEVARGRLVLRLLALPREMRGALTRRLARLGVEIDALGQTDRREGRVER